MGTFYGLGVAAAHRPMDPHFHALILEGGFDDEGTFFYMPFSGLHSMVEVFRRRVIKLLVELKLVNDVFARGRPATRLQDSM